MGNTRILFISHVNANDKMEMAGVPYHMSRALQEHCGEVDIVSPVDGKVASVGQVVRRSARIFGQQRDGLGNTIVSKLIAHNVQQMTAGERYDFTFVGFGHMVAAHLRLSCPLIYASDTTYSQLADYYSHRTKMTDRVWRENNLLEQRALNNAFKLIYPSSFAASSAMSAYGCPPDKIHVVPSGANLDVAPDTDTVRRAICQRRQAGICRLLFIGRDWERKGGAIALEAFSALERMKIPVEMIFIGSQPLEPAPTKNVTFIPFLDKNSLEDARRLSDLLLSATFLLLPTRADQFGIVFCEASAYGVPSITTDTGGVGSAVEEGVNGYRLPLEARGTDYAERIASIYNDAKAYDALATSSRERYEDVLNWDSWGKSVSQILLRR